MSALAARRAAAAVAAAAAAPLVSNGRSAAGPSSSKKRRVASPRRSPSSGATASLRGLGDDSEDLDGRHGHRLASTAHVGKTSSTPRKSDKSTRHPIEEAEQVTPATRDDVRPRRTRRQKAFSPSIPVAEDDDMGFSSSGDDSGSMNGAGWTGSTPNAIAGFSRSVARSEAYLPPATSIFTPREGVNIMRVTAETLGSAGLTFMDGNAPGVVVSLTAADKLFIAGLYTITVLRGAIRVGGTTIQASHPATTYPVFSPTSHPNPALVADIPSRTASSIKIDHTTSLPLPASFALEPDRVMIWIRENTCGLLGLQNGAVPGFSSIWLDSLSPGTWGLKGVHPVGGSFPTSVYPTSLPESWTHALSTSIVAPDADTNGDSPPDLDASEPRTHILLVRGLKRAGKSTFARLALNALLSTHKRVAWLECDLGQGEFGCGGVVGLWLVDQPLLGPPFTHPILPIRAHFMGTYTPNTCPDEYIQAISQLSEYYRYELEYDVHRQYGDGHGKRNDIPLIVNTQGWVKGLGEELLDQIENITQPSHIFTLGELNSESGKEDAPGWTNSPSFRMTSLPGEDQSTATHIQLQAAPESPLQARYTPADLRTLSTIAYFHARFSTATGQSQQWDFDRPLVACPPWSVTLGPGEVIERVYLTGEGAEGVLTPDIPLALNGSVIALLETTDAQTSLDNDEDAYVQGRKPPPYHMVNFLGLAIIRALRVLSEEPLKIQLHILSPLPIEVLQRTKMIVKNGAMELPVCGMLDWRGDTGLFDSSEMPYLDARQSSGAIGGEKRRFRRNLMRKGV